MGDILTDPRLAKPMAVLMAACIDAEAYNHPIKASEKVRTSGKPGSRPPGEQQCVWVVNRLASILEKACASATQAVEIAAPKDVRAETVYSVGGIPLRRTVRVEVIEARLVAKYGSSALDTSR